MWHVLGCTKRSHGEVCDWSNWSLERNINVWLWFLVSLVHQGLRPSWPREEITPSFEVWQENKPGHPLCSCADPWRGQFVMPSFVLYSTWFLIFWRCLWEVSHAWTFWFSILLCFRSFIAEMTIFVRQLGRSKFEFKPVLNSLLKGIVQPCSLLTFIQS